ncbi:unnamed protein product [Withania somnifera]
MRLQTYAGLSLVATLAVIYHAFNSRGQFYPAMVYLSTSKIILVLLLNMHLVFMCILWQLTEKIFLGPLREAEDFSVTFLAMVTVLLLIKGLHWLAQKRVEYIETTPTVTRLSHLRIVSFLGFLLFIDSLFLYMILVTTTVSTFVKYVFYISDMLMEGQWENNPVYAFYLELFRDLLHLSLYFCFLMVIFMNYGVHLHLIRELCETFRNFKVRVANYVRYRKITSNKHDHFPDATPEELNASDATCIICREEMTTAKKLICGHLFHVHCLCSWLERQHSCPTCRALVVPAENGTNVVGSRSDVQPGTGSSVASASQSPQADTTPSNNVNQHQARIQAAASAAAVYQKSFVYPSVPTVAWSPGYAPVPPSYSPVGSSANVLSDGERALNEQSLHGQLANMAFAQYRQCGYLPFQYPGVINLGIPQAQLEAHKILLQQQIELKLLENPNTHRKADDSGISVSKGKGISSESSRGQSEGSEI